MAQKTKKVRHVQKHDVEANWLKATNFIPLVGEIVIYDPDDNYDYPRIKIGDGVKTINALPFTLNVISINEINEICGMEIESASEVQL